RAGIEDGERQTRLENRHATDLPAAKGYAPDSRGVLEERKLIGVADRETMRPVEVGDPPRRVDIALIVVGGVKGCVPSRRSINVLREGIRRLEIIVAPPP